MRMLIEVYFAGLAVVVLVATGCGQDSVTAPAEKLGTIPTADTTLPRAETVKAASRAFTLSIDLPGASVHGFETTLVSVSRHIRHLWPRFRCRPGRRSDSS